MKAEFKDGFAVDFKMALADCFKDSLAKERFNTGDIIYNNKHAYSSPWSSAIKHLTYGFQVVQMTGEEIEYVILRKNADGSSLVKDEVVKQTISDFIHRLKTGF